MTKKRPGKRRSKPKGRTSGRALTPERELEVVASFLAGESQPSLAERLGVGLNTVVRCLRRHGVSVAAREAPAGGKADQAALELFRAVGMPPVGDALGSSAWLHKLLCVAVAQAASDGTLSEKQRRRELVSLSKAAVAAFPMRILDEASRLIGAERGILKAFDRPVETVSAAELDATDRAAARAPMKSVNAHDWEGRSPEELDS